MYVGHVNHPMANRQWVNVALSLHRNLLTPRPTVCEWHQHLFSLFSLITSYPMINSMWVTLTFISAIQSHHISSHDQQQVSDTDIYFCHSVSSHLIPWPTASEWHWHLFLSFSLITSHPMTNSLWVTLTFISAIQSHHISSHDQQEVSDTDIYFCHSISSHLIPWPTVCEWHQHLFLPFSLIISHPMMNSLWVTPTFISAMLSHHTSLHNQQHVSVTAFSVLNNLIHGNHGQQQVCDFFFFFCKAALSYIINRM